MWDLPCKAWFSLKNVGWARTLLRATQRTFPAWLFSFNSLIAAESRFEDVHKLTPIDPWQYRWAVKEDLDFLTAGGLTEVEVNAFWELGGHAALCTKDEKLVGYTWYLDQNPVVFDWLRITTDRDVYGAAGFVAPEFRGRRIQSQARYFAYPALAEMGFTGVMSFLEIWNRSTMRSADNGIRRFIGRVIFLRLFGLVIYRIAANGGGVLEPVAPAGAVLGCVRPGKLLD